MPQATADRQDAYPGGYQRTGVGMPESVQGDRGQFLGHRNSRVITNGNGGRGLWDMAAGSGYLLSLGTFR